MSLPIFGAPGRAEELLVQRLRKGFDDNVIKSFDVDADFLDHLRRIAVAEEDTRRLGFLTFRCDPSRAPDQYGLRRHQIEELIPQIVPGSGESDEATRRDSTSPAWRRAR